MKKTVCIIGCGPSGLTALKSSLEVGFEAVVLEKKLTLGGDWSLDDTKAWDSLETNISKYSMSFSDFPFPDHGNVYINQKKHYEYLNNYCHHFGLEKYIKYNCNVEKAIQIDNDRWLIQWKDEFYNIIETKEFDYLIVCNGVNNVPRHFPMEPLKQFTGGYRYSKDYKNPDHYVGKNVLVVGKSCSGIQIASELCTSGASSVVLYGKGKDCEWGVPAKIHLNLLKDDHKENDDSGLPLDFVFSIRRRAYEFNKLPEKERNIEMNKFYKQISNNNCDEPSYHVDESEFYKPPQVLYTTINSYFDNIKQKKIRCLSNHTIKSSNGKSIEFISNEPLKEPSVILEFDEIIFATGYHSNLSFFEKRVLDAISFDSKDNYLPCLLYLHTFPPNINNLGFVGQFGTTFHTVLELQSRWINYVFANIVKLPSKEIILDGIDECRKIRNMKYKTSYSIGEYTIFCDRLAKEMGVLPNFDELKVKDPKLYNILWNSYLASESYRLCGPFSNYEKSSQLLFKSYDIFNKLYKSNK